MKKQKLIFLLCISIFFLISFNSLKDGYKSIQDGCFPLIWNQGITKKSWVYLNQDETKVYKKNSDISEGDDLKMPKNNWDATYTDTQSKQQFSTPNKTNASFKLVTLGYKVDDQKKQVGFDFSILNNSKNNNDPYIFRVVNNSRKENIKNIGNLREVGFVFENWPQYWKEANKWTGGLHSFSDNYQVESLDNLKVKFKFRLVNFNAPLYKSLIKEKWLGSYMTCDLRFNEYDEKVNIINKYLVGVIFSNPLNVDFNDNPNDAVLFGKGSAKAGEQQILLLHGNKVGIKEVNTVGKTNDFKTVEIDFKPLINRYLNINKNRKNILTGLDIYSATRGVDFTYEIQDIQVTGCQ